MSEFVEVTDGFDRESGGERWLRRLSDKAWISVLHRRTGFGHMEWETAVVCIMDDNDPRKFARGKWDDRDMVIVLGDHRDELRDASEQEVMKWAAAHCMETNSFETLLRAYEVSHERP